MPKFNLVLDSSQIYEIQTCPLKWFYRYHELLNLNEAQRVAPDMGTLVHNLLDIYYTMRSLTPNANKLEQANAVIEVYRKANTTKSLFPADDGSLDDFLCKRFMLYVQRWLTDDFNVEVGGVELGFSHLLFENEQVRFILEGRIDLLNKIQGYNCFTDHKTQERTINLYHYTPQFKTYALVTGYEYGLVNYFGMQEDKTNKLMKENKLFRRDLIHFDKWLIEEWKEKLIETFWQVYGLLNVAASHPKFELEKLIYAKRNDSACGGPFNSNPCQFTHICEAHETMKEQVKKMKYTIGEAWSPW